MSSILLVLVSYVLALAAWPVLAVLFLFARPVPGRYGARGRKGVAAPAQASAPSDRISIVILNWNGRDLLSDNLPSVVEAVQRAGMEDEVLVVDNGSTDGSVEFLREEFPTVRVLSLPHNRGFGEGNNAGVRAARHDLVLLLNNDMKVDPDFLAPLRRGFREPRVFAVSSQIFFQDPVKLREETGRTFAVFRRGWIEYGHGPMPETAGAEFLQVLWAGGGSSAFHRARFLELGGFDPLYSPAYVEDADLSYRAWQRGWVVLMAPASRVYHKHRATSGRRFTPLQVEQLVLRNQWLFLWKNLHDWSWLALHLWHLPALIRRRGDELGFATVGSFCQALKRWPSLWSARRRALRLRDDAEIFGRACSGVSFLAGEPRVPGRDRLHILYITAYLPHLGRHAGAGRMYHLIRLLASRH
ncbi:MAG: glycosyltransferase family 2 protein, partial [Acidobacteria bacterium]|nr:glycosyltransferase family 2 protein [Acidobacteriota bacterium]